MCTQEALKKRAEGRVGGVGAGICLFIYLISWLTSSGSGRVDCQLGISSLFLLGFSLFCFCSPNAGSGASVLIIAGGTTTAKHLKFKDHKESNSSVIISNWC